MKGRVLIVDDEKNMGLVIQAMLERAGFEVLTFSDAKEAMEAIESEELDAVVTDLYMPGAGGMEVLAHTKHVQPQVPVVMITAFGTVESAVSALKRGAFDFITKPFDQSELLAVIEKACLTHRASEKEPAPHFPSGLEGEILTGAASGAYAEKDPEFSFSGESEKLLELRRKIEKVAPSDAIVLLEGESGTGKELVAQEIHSRSPRAEKSLIKVNCAAIPANLMESELFGFERGAFSGAVSSKPGRFELAHEGTLFLDEVTEIPYELQVKLLRAIADQEFERVGGLGTIQVSVRVIAATDRSLYEEVRQGKFREDLYYRLSVAPIILPPLRERREDIELLIQRFITRFNEKFSKSVVRVSVDALSTLKNYRWPGNIRQLENVMERMVLMSDSETLAFSDLPEEIASETPGASGASADSEPLSFKETIRRQTQAMERTLIEKALDETDGNVTRTAAALGLSRKGLQLKMKELGIKR